MFEDSPTCLKFGAKEEPRQCSDCLLMQFVPEERKKLAYPCRQIPLTPAGESVAHYYSCGTETEMEAALKAWLQRKIAELEAKTESTKESTETAHTPPITAKDKRRMLEKPSEE